MKLTHPKPPPQINEIIQRTGASRVPVSQFLNGHIDCSKHSASILCHAYALQQERNITAHDIVRELTVEGLTESMKVAFADAFKCDRFTAVTLLCFLRDCIEAKIKFRHIIIDNDCPFGTELHLVLNNTFLRLYCVISYSVLEIGGVKFESKADTNLIDILTAHLGKNN